MHAQQSAVLPTPYGEITVTWAGDTLIRIWLGPYGVHTDREQEMQTLPEFPVLRLLVAYFQGDPVTFSVPLDRTGHTEFQWQVWTALREIPYGATRTYGWVAQRIGRPTAARAVGGAVGRNPFPIVVPCHRVIGADGDLVGFGAGLDWKRALLRLEGVLPSWRTCPQEPGGLERSPPPAITRIAPTDPTLHEVAKGTTSGPYLRLYFPPSVLF